LVLEPPAVVSGIDDFAVTRELVEECGGPGMDTQSGKGSHNCEQVSEVLRISMLAVGLESPGLPREALGVDGLSEHVCSNFEDLKQNRMLSYGIISEAGACHAGHNKQVSTSSSFRVLQKTEEGQ
jgi:hypothetical protein